MATALVDPNCPISAPKFKMDTALKSVPVAPITKEGYQNMRKNRAD